MPTEPTPPAPAAGGTQQLLFKAAAGLVLLAVAGVAGGSIAGFRVEPEGCAQCRVDLATCAARDELVATSLDEAKAAVVAMSAELAALRTEMGQLQGQLQECP